MPPSYRPDHCRPWWMRKSMNEREKRNEKETLHNGIDCPLRFMVCRCIRIHVIPSSDAAWCRSQLHSYIQNLPLVLIFSTYHGTVYLLIFPIFFSISSRLCCQATTPMGKFGFGQNGCKNWTELMSSGCSNLSRGLIWASDRKFSIKQSNTVGQLDGLVIDRESPSDYAFHFSFGRCCKSCARVPPGVCLRSGDLAISPETDHKRSVDLKKQPAGFFFLALW